MEWFNCVCRYPAAGANLNPLSRVPAYAFIAQGNGSAALPIGARRYMQKVEIRVFCTKCVILGLDPIICLKRFPGQARE